MKGILFLMGSLLLMLVYQILYILTKNNFNNIMSYVWSIAVIIAILGNFFGVFEE